MLPTRARWGIRDGRKSAFIVVTENRPMVPIYLELVRTIVMVPAVWMIHAKEEVFFFHVCNIDFPKGPGPS